MQVRVLGTSSEHTHCTLHCLNQKQWKKSIKYFISLMHVLYYMGSNSLLKWSALAKLRLLKASVTWRRPPSQLTCISVCVGYTGIVTGSFSNHYEPLRTRFLGERGAKREKVRRQRRQERKNTMPKAVGFFFLKKL